MRKTRSHLLTTELNTFLELEVSKYTKQPCEWSEEGKVLPQEESPMLNFTNRQYMRKQSRVTNTPSPRSRTSYTEESPHFALDGRSFTPSSNGGGQHQHRGTDIGGKPDSQFGHMLSFGGYGQDFFMAEKTNNSRRVITQ